MVFPTFFNLSLNFSLGFSLSLDFPGDSDSKVSVYNAGDLGSIPGSGRSSGEGNDNPFQYSCLKNPIGKDLEKLEPSSIAGGDVNRCCQLGKELVSSSKV